MPERKYHLAKATYNFEVSTHLKDTEYIDWAVTALFYSALHLVDAFLDGETSLVKDERHPRKHSANASNGNGGRGRNQLVASVLRPISKEYRSLHEASRRARYDFHKLDKASADSVSTYQRLQEQYKAIERYVKMRIVAQNSAA